MERARLKFFFTQTAPAKYIQHLGGLVFFEGLSLVLVALLSRHYLESAMLSHMLIQFPLILICGYKISQIVSSFFSKTCKRWSQVSQFLISFDSFGISGLLLLLLVSAFWMVPRVLEESLTNENIELLKFISLLLLGSVLPSSLRRSNWITQLFFLGNFCGMTAIVGLIYQEIPQRLCNSYLIDDQKYTGIGLVCMSLVIPVVWCIAYRGYFVDKTSKVH